MIEAFWQAYCEALGVSGPVPVVSAFGDGVAMQDELCALVVAGEKRGTATLAMWYDNQQETLPQAGEVWIFTDGAGVPRGVVETVDVTVKKFCEVDEAFAAEEGEGDKSLAYWQREHRRFFADDLARDGLVFSEDMPVVLERFRLVWVPVPADGV
jgi:uncharacterized protein YhfF